VADADVGVKPVYGIIINIINIIFAKFGGGYWLYHT